MEDNKGRDLVSRGLRTKAPKPNIIRIEVLDGNSRERYLGRLQRKADNIIKQPLYDKFVPPSQSIFYGFLKNVGSQTVGISAQWTKSDGVKGLLGDITGVLSKASTGKKGKVGKFFSFAGAAGAFGLSAKENIDKAAKGLGSLDTSLTGNSTIKQVTGVDVNGFEVDCGWYLPEQLNLASNSLKILNNMAYPNKVPSTDIVDKVKNTVGNIFKSDNVTDNDNAGIAPSLTQAANTTQDTTASSLGFGAISLYAGFNDLVGRNLTLDPLPVRVNVGHYIDIEPMVITGIKVTFSREQFVAPNGRHLPIFCTVNISFTSWMTPSPDLEFMQLLGTEMFGSGVNNG